MRLLTVSVAALMFAPIGAARAVEFPGPWLELCPAVMRTLSLGKYNVQNCGLAYMKPPIGGRFLVYCTFDIDTFRAKKWTAYFITPSEEKLSGPLLALPNVLPPQNEVLNRFPEPGPPKPCPI